jgi:hypothetical protein
VALTVGFPELDSIIGRDQLVEFYSLDWELLKLFYHRVIALSAPVTVVVVAERGGLDPQLVERFQRTFGTRGEVRVMRGFKVEDVPPTLQVSEEEMIVVDPYHHRRKYSTIVSALRSSMWRKFVFSFMDRESEGSTFGLHSAHSVFELKRGIGGFAVRVVKSVTTGELEIPYGNWDMFGRGDPGLMRWLLR